MQSGMINKVAITGANKPDGKVFKNVSPRQGAVYADKAYCGKDVQNDAKARNVHLAAIKKNNMKDKNRDLDRYYSKMRSPYERVFAHQNNRVRFIGIAKNQFAELMNAMCFNMRRMVALAS